MYAIVEFVNCQLFNNANKALKKIVAPFFTGCISSDNNLEVIGSIRSNGKKKLSTRTTAENEKAYSPGHSLCTECGK
jgi:hypothetical protein